MKKYIIASIVAVIIFSAAFIYLGGKGNIDIAGSWTVSGYPDFPFVETYIFGEDNIFTRYYERVETDENNKETLVKYLEETGVYTLFAKTVSITFDDKSLGTVKYTVVEINNDKITLKNSSGDKMTYVKEK